VSLRPTALERNLSDQRIRNTSRTELVSSQPSRHTGAPARSSVLFIPTQSHRSDVPRVDLNQCIAPSSDPCATITTSSDPAAHARLTRPHRCRTVHFSRLLQGDVRRIDVFRSRYQVCNPLTRHGTERLWPSRSVSLRYGML